MKLRPAILAVVLVSTVTALSGNWPQFRGPDGEAKVGGAAVPVSFGVEDYLWDVELPGAGHSSPVVWDKRVFVTSLAGDAADKRSLICLSLEDGETMWTKTFDYKPHSLHKFNNFASTTPCVDAERVYITWATGEEREVIALSHEGDEEWREVVGDYREEHGTAASPVLVEGVLIIQNDHAAEGALLGLDPESGRRIWEHGRKAEKTSFSTPVIYRPDGGDVQVVFAGSPYGLTSLDPKDGRVLWESEGQFVNRTVSTPVVAGGTVFATAGQGGGGKESMAVRPEEGKRKLGTAFNPTRSLPYVPSPVSHDGLIFLWTDGGIVNCLDGETGESLWLERASGPAFASPVVVGEVLYGFSKTGEVVALAASREFKKLGESNVGEPIHATPAVLDDRMLIRTETRLICVGSSSGKRL